MTIIDYLRIELYFWLGVVLAMAAAVAWAFYPKKPKKQKRDQYIESVLANAEKDTEEYRKKWSGY